MIHQFGMYYNLFAVWIILGILLAIFAFIIYIAICVWLYRDAKKRNMEAAVWLLMVLLFSIIAIIIYLIVRDPLPPKVRQPPQAQQVQYYYEPRPAAPQYAPIPKEKPVKYCRTCGGRMPIDALFCSNCGKKV